MCRTYTCVPRSFSFTRHHRPAINSPAQRETKPKKAHTVLYVSHHAITLTNQSRRTHPFFHPLSKTTKGGRKLSFRPNCSRVRSSSFFLSFSAILLFPVWPTFSCISSSSMFSLELFDEIVIIVHSVDISSMEFKSQVSFL